MKIASLERSKRPREVAFEKGMEGLSNAELLALLLSSGTARASALDVSSALLSDFGGLSSLSSCPYLAFERELGVGRAKSSILGACFEIARRLRGQEKAKSLDEEIDKDLQSKKEEALYAYFLSANDEVVGKRLLLLGTPSSLKGAKRALLSSLCYAPSGALLLVHCHPSGNPLPSKEDIEFTGCIVSFARAFGLPFKDHIIVARSGRFSFRENGLLR